MEQTYNQIYLDLSEYTNKFSNETIKPKPKFCLENIGKRKFGLDISINENTGEIEVLIMPVHFLSDYEFRVVSESVYFSLVYKGYMNDSCSAVKIFNLFSLSKNEPKNGNLPNIEVITINNIDQFDATEKPEFCGVDKINCFCLEGLYETSNSLKEE